MGATTLAPGQETSVSLDMMMHPGMEGPHLFRVTVPVSGAGNIELYVKADFQ